MNKDDITLIPIADIVVLHMSATECGLVEYPSGELDKGTPRKLIGRRKDMKIVFEHLTSGGVALTQKVGKELGGRKGVYIRLWLKKSEEQVK